MTLQTALVIVALFQSPDSTVVGEIPQVIRDGDDKIELSEWCKRLPGKLALPVRVVSTDGNQVVLFPEDVIEIKVGGKWVQSLDSTWRDQLQVSKVWSDSTLAVQGIALFQRVSLKHIEGVRITMQGQPMILTRKGDSP